MVTAAAISSTTWCSPRRASTSDSRRRRPWCWTSPRRSSTRQRRRGRRCWRSTRSSSWFMVDGFFDPEKRKAPVPTTRTAMIATIDATAKLLTTLLVARWRSSFSRRAAFCRSRLEVPMVPTSVDPLKALIAQHPWRSRSSCKNSGGATVGNAERIPAMAQRQSLALRRQGDEVVVVVSAMGGRPTISSGRRVSPTSGPRNGHALDRGRADFHGAREYRPQYRGR